MSSEKRTFFRMFKRGKCGLYGNTINAYVYLTADEFVRSREADNLSDDLDSFFHIEICDDGTYYMCIERDEYIHSSLSKLEDILREWLSGEYWCEVVFSPPLSPTVPEMTDSSVQYPPVTTGKRQKTILEERIINKLVEDMLGQPDVLVQNAIKRWRRLCK